MQVSFQKDKILIMKTLTKNKNVEKCGKAWNPTTVICFYINRAYRQEKSHLIAGGFRL